MHVIQAVKYQIDVWLALNNATMALMLSASEANLCVEMAVAQSRNYYTLAVKGALRRAETHISCQSEHVTLLAAL
jgi:hypothetical protein